MPSILALLTSRPRLALAVVALLGSSWIVPSPAAAQRRPIVVQTNAAGDNVHLIDPATNTIVGEITGVEVIHGVAAAPDGSTLYLTNESTEMLDIVDVKPGQPPAPLFTGWMFASSPALSALEHPVYDVWVIDCSAAAPEEPAGQE